MKPLLLRLELPQAIHSPADITALQRGLSLHLRYRSLRSLLVQVGTVQQSYVSLEGCGGCIQGRCVLGCPVETLRRTIYAGLHPEAELLRVRTGLVERPAVVAYIATPTPKAQPLDGRLLHGWGHATLVVNWLPHHPLRLGPQAVHAWALCIAGGSGPDLAGALADYGWTARRIVPALAVQMRNHPGIATLAAKPWPHTPWLALPVSVPARITVPVASDTPEHPIELHAEAPTS
jgi:hypothetical protein